MRAWSREQIATVAFSWIKVSPTARPSPLDAPATSAFLPVRPKSMLVLLQIGNQSLANQLPGLPEIDILGAREIAGELGDDARGNLAHPIGEGIGREAEAHERVAAEKLSRERVQQG